MIWSSITTIRVGEVLICRLDCLCLGGLLPRAGIDYLVTITGRDIEGGLFRALMKEPFKLSNKCFFRNDKVNLRRESAGTCYRG